MVCVVFIVTNKSCSPALSFHPHVESILGVGGDDTVRLWDLDSSKEMSKISIGDTAGITDVAWSNTGKYVSLLFIPEGGHTFTEFEFTYIMYNTRVMGGHLPTY